MVHEYEADKVNRVGSGRFSSTEPMGDNALLPPGTQGMSTSAYAVQLQRQYGNRYVQRVMALARMGDYPPAVIRRDDNDDQQKPAPLVGQDRAVDPKDNMCSLQWTPGGKHWLLPSGVSCDPGVAHVPSHGDPLKYPGDQPDSPSGTVDGMDRPASCPAERWEPPSPRNLYYGRCRAPGASPGSPSPSSPSPSPDPAFDYGPGDYNVPDESDAAVA